MDDNAVKRVGISLHRHTHTLATWVSSCMLPGNTVDHRAAVSYETDFWMTIEERFWARRFECHGLILVILGEGVFEGVKVRTLRVSHQVFRHQNPVVSY